MYENLLLCCVQCNQRKGDLDLEDYRELYHGGDLFYYEILEGTA